jgi:hypothetical protein
MRLHGLHVQHFRIADRRDLQNIEALRERLKGGRRLGWFNQQRGSGGGRQEDCCVASTGLSIH